MSAAIGEKEREAAIAELLRSGCSCVICNASGLHSFYRRGVADLYELLLSPIRWWAKGRRRSWLPGEWRRCGQA